MEQQVIMDWNTVIVTVSVSAMDPGIRSCSQSSKSYYRELIKEGQYLSYDDSSGTLPSIKVLEVKDDSLKIAVGKEKVVEIEPGKTVLLCQTGYNYAYFELEILLSYKEGPGFVSVSSGDVIAVANDRYKVFALSPSVVDDLQSIADGSKNWYYSGLKRDYWYLLGRWYWLTQPEGDSDKKAEELFRRAEKDGCADALMGLANMYRYGGMDEIDLEKYVELRNEAREKGSKVAELAYCLDLADGVGCKADIAAAEKLAEKHTYSRIYSSPEWYCARGWVLLKQGMKEEARKMFTAAVDNDFWSAYDGLLEISKEPEVVVCAMRSGCGKAYSEVAENDIVKYLYSENESEKAELSKNIISYYEKALKMGDVSAAGSLCEIYKDGLYGIGKSLSKSLKYASYSTLVGRR